FDDCSSEVIEAAAPSTDDVLDVTDAPDVDLVSRGSARALRVPLPDFDDQATVRKDMPSSPLSASRLPTPALPMDSPFPRLPAHSPLPSFPPPSGMYASRP